MPSPPPWDTGTPILRHRDERRPDPYYQDRNNRPLKRRRIPDERRDVRPRFARNIRPRHESFSKNKLFIAGFGHRQPIEEVVKEAEQFGRIKNVESPKPRGRRMPFIFVDYMDFESAKNALEGLQGLQVFDGKLSVEWSRGAGEAASRKPGPQNIRQFPGEKGARREEEPSTYTGKEAITAHKEDLPASDSDRHAPKEKADQGTSKDDTDKAPDPHKSVYLDNTEEVEEDDLVDHLNEYV
ncbi:hypothetical protein CANCADRAFT_42395 [Tortispora caseinolytica NRRL Y-17796]|uniref:RRM domain-containing protein n=1 Tax=Tortispora caseinolytica NRRL Y-17796 TaxID=767744 RepID=A0A1E4TJ21_9ASCO|nr:hypothetical protein CANCADRAFT_42395 [Tortispora caseinolytica NRRL Y-17796]